MAPAHAVDAGPHAPPASHGHGAPRRHSGSHSRTRASTRHAKHSASAPSSQSPPSGFRPPHKLHAAADADEGRSAHGFRSGHRPSPDSRHHPRHAAEAAEHPDAGHNNSNNNNALLDSFFFRRRRERLNWRMLAAIDADRVMRDVDVPALQEIMENVTFCDIDAEDLRYIDPNFVKLFRLAQMMIEYLLHSQDYLADQRAELRQELDELRLIHRQDTESIEALTADSDAAKKELRTLRKTLYAYQLVAKLPGGISQNTSSQAVYHRCMHCPKVFSSQQYLDAHLQRRHSEHVPVFSQHPARHNDSDPTQAGSSDFQKMADMIERFSIRLLDAEKQMRGDSESKIEDRVSKEVAARKTVMEDMYKQERLRFEKELQDLKASIHKQLTEERAMLQEEKEKFESYMEQELRKKSHVGVIEDDDDQVKPAKAAELVSAPTPTPPEPPKPTIEELQKIQAAQAAQLAKEMEERQEMALKSVQDRIAQELGSMRSSLITQHEQERMALEQQLASAATEIHEMRELLAHHHETDLAAIMAAAKAAAAASATAQPESVQTLPRTSQLSQQTSEQSTPAVPMEQPTEPKVKLNVPRPNLRVSISAAPQTPLTPAIGPAAVSVVPEKTASSEDNLFTELNDVLGDLDSPENPFKTPMSAAMPMADNGDEEEWEAIMATMRQHTKTPNATAPWIKSLFDHRMDQIQDAKNTLSTQTDQYLSKRGVDMSRIFNEWAINAELPIEFAQLSMQMHEERRQDSQDRHLLGRMRTHLEKQVDVIAAEYVAKRQAMPPASLSRQSSARPPSMISRPRGSIMVSAGSQPARRSRSQSVSINPVPPSVEIFDQSMPIASSFSRRGLSQPTMSPSYASGRHVRERHMSVATTVSDMSESEDVLRERMGGFTDASAKFAVASVTSPASQTSTAKSPSFKPTLQDTLRNVSKNIAKRLFKRAGDASSSSAPSTPAIGLPTMPAPAAGAGAGVGMSPLHEEDENTSGGTMSSHTYSSAYSTSEYDDDHEEREEAQVQRVQERAPVKITGLPPLPKPPVAQPMPSINMSNASKSLPAPPRGPPPAPPSVNATQQQQILPDDVSFSISDISGLSDPSNSDRPSQRSRSASISISDPSESDQMSAGRAPSDSTDSSLLDGLNAEFANQAASQQVQLPTGGGGGGIRAGLGSMPDSSQMGLAARSDSDSDDMFDLLDDMEVSSETRTASRASMLSQVPGGGLGGLGELGGGHGGSLPSVAASVGTRGSVSGGGTDAVVMDDVDDFDD